MSAKGHQHTHINFDLYIKLTRKLKFSTSDLLYSKPTFTWVPLIQI